MGPSAPRSQAPRLLLLDREAAALGVGQEPDFLVGELSCALWGALLLPGLIPRAVILCRIVTALGVSALGVTWVGRGRGHVPGQVLTP